MNRPVRAATPPSSATAALPWLAAALLLGGTLPAGFAAPVTVLSSYPLFLTPPLAPNLLVLLDNSGSMDSTMAGKAVSGDDPQTRGNIAREVLRNVIDANRSTFNWGLGTFELRGSPQLFNTMVQFAGSASTMVYSNDCKLSAGSLFDLSGPADATGYSAAGPQVVISAPSVTPVVYKNNCVQNPDVDGSRSRAPRNGYRYLTFESSSDDPNINDRFYTSFGGDFAFGLGVSGGTGSTYQLYQARDATTAWTAANFPAADCLSGYCPTSFTLADSGWLPLAAAQPRLLFIKRGWGYASNITGAGRVVEPVVSSARSTPAEVAAEAAHHANLMTALAPETFNASGEIKNAASFTPLAGSLRTVHDYFAGLLSGALRSPVTQSCQRNYVVLATDGNPTGKLNGDAYLPAEVRNTRDAAGNWTYGQAQQDVFAEIGAFSRSGPTAGLRATTLTGSNLSNGALLNRRFDVQSYVIGIGDTLANASSVAALNRMAQLGGGYPQAFLGSTPAALESAFQTIVSSVEQKQGEGGSSSVALNGSTLDAGSTLYQATFDSSKWSGDLRAFTVGASGLPSAAPQWSAAARLATKDWDTGRTLLTARPDGAGGVTGIAFRWPANAALPQPTELAASQIAALNTDATGTVDNLGALRLRYLRGDRSQECAACSPAFRDRGVPAGAPRGPALGDLVDSAPVLVGAPSAGYYDDIEASAYGSFASAQRNRKKVIYVGGNDGMLHAFSADSADGGTELLGYVPSPLVASLSQLTSTGYRHRFFADGTPTVGDAFHDGSWKTLLVSGMRAGAKGVFALDVTNPAAFREAAAANVVRWEFLNTHDADMGYVFSQPVIVKTNNGRWSVVVANGYNSGAGAASRSSGHAVLFVLDAETGAVVSKIDTGSGSLLSPNGLSGPAVIDTNDDGIADVVYAGDLNGNLWKFDLSSTAAASWGVANGGLALFNTDEANPTAGTRPITSRPDVTAVPRGGYMVVFGSGSYLSAADASSTGQQALYGIWDDGLRRAGTVTQAELVRQSVAATASGADGALYRLTTHVVGTPVDSLIVGDTPSVTRVDYDASRRGWLLDLPTSGERAVTDVRIRGGRAVFTTLIPNTADPCSYGGGGWLMELDVVTGNRDDRGTFDTDNSGSVDTGDNLRFTAAGNSTSSGRYFGGGIPAAPGSTVNTGTTPPANGALGRPACVRVLYVAKSDGTTETVRVSCDATPFGRALWREVR